MNDNASYFGTRTGSTPVVGAKQKSENMCESKIQMLPALHGDAFIVHCKKGEEKGVVVVDGGPSSNGTKNPFVKEVENYLPINLMVMTHHDDDHLVGILRFVKNHLNDESFPVQRMWVNCARKIDFETSSNLSATKAHKLADTLSEIENKSGLIWKDDIVEGYDTSVIPFADIDVLNPDTELLKVFLERFEEKKPAQEVNISDDHKEEKKEDIDIDMHELAMRPKIKPNLDDYQKLTNAVSISFVLECDGLKLLMLGDSYPCFIVEALKRRGYSEEKKLKVDYVKVSHHGSPNNISNELLALIECDSFLISTNGGTGRSKHPQRETIANILCHPRRNYEKTVHLFFNYKLSQIEGERNKIFNNELDGGLNYRIHENELQ